jgi:hypothetical protein
MAEVTIKLRLTRLGRALAWAAPGVGVVAGALPGGRVLASSYLDLVKNLAARGRLFEVAR